MAFEFWVGKSLYGDDLDEATQDVRKILNKICATYLYPVNVKAYKHGGHHKHGGSQWADLAESTWKRKLKKGHNKILVETDATRSSLVCAVEPQGSFELRVKVGVHTPYAKYLASGTEHMPARLPVDVTDEDMKKVAQRLQTAMDKEING